MINSRKHAKNTLRSVRSLKEKHEYLKEYHVRLMGQSAFDQMQSSYDEFILKLVEAIKKLPIGNRYSGTFYVRNPYSVPIEYDKIDGTAFMPENLVSWKIENIEKYKYSYARAIYREPNDNAENEIKREDAEPVYQDEMVED